MYALPIYLRWSTCLYILLLAVCKEQDRKNLLLFTFRLHMFPMFDDGLAIGELLQYSLQEIEKVAERDLTELIWN